MFDLQIQKDHHFEQQKGFVPSLSSQNCEENLLTLKRYKNISNASLFCVLLRLEVEVYFKGKSMKLRKIISHLISNCLIFLQEFCQCFIGNGYNQVFNMSLAPSSSQRQLRSIPCDKPALHRCDKRLK